MNVGKARSTTTSLAALGSLSWRREGPIFGFVDVPVESNNPGLPSPRTTLVADAKPPLAFLAPWR